VPQEPLIARVIIDLPVREINRVFDYFIPDYLAESVEIGSVVLVPFGKTKQVGYVVDRVTTSDVPNLVGIEAVVQEKPAFNHAMVELCGWIARYYLSTINDALKLALPPGHGSKVIQSLKITEASVEKLPARQAEIYEALVRLGGNAPADAVKSACGGANISQAITKLCERGYIERYCELERPKVKEATARFALLIPATLAEADIERELKRSPKQRDIIDMLVRRGDMEVAKLLAEVAAPYSSLQGLVSKEMVRVEERPVHREPEHLYKQTDTAVTLTDEQQVALTAISGSIENSTHDVFLLQGVTGSGKTEIYLRAIRLALELGKSAIVLVPEIALTAQVVARFKARFGDAVAVLHSGLGAGERFDQWRRIQEGRYRVVVGARSAVFAPVSNLGIIVVDEEHEGSYKQGRSPRYNARDVAIKRAELEGACTVLGSATPALETKWHSETGLYRPLFLHKRVQERSLPRIEIVDMREEPKGETRPIIGGVLANRLVETFDDGGKAILFLNRRGFSNFIICEECGFVPKCRNCAVSLTYHSVNHSLRCHHCNFAAKAPDACPKCGAQDIQYPGVGTQRVEAELSRLYPDIPVIRMDADTTARKGAHQKRLVRFEAESSAILLGTQMIAKGLDFPEVTLVGVINADTSLHLPDFRAGEHTFQVLMQVAGRAGRGERPGTVVIQTYSPGSYPLQAVLAGDYDEFYKEEVEHRRELYYPPFTTIIRLLFSSADPQAVVGLTRRAAKIMEAAGLDSAVDIVGPSPAPLLKVKGDYRWHILLKVRDTLTAKSFLEDNFSRFVPASYQNVVSLSIDVDPNWVL
jgi:primosomal protein N' (replication factor Y)